ncbi:MAG TPA: polysaccharide biosynthesis tyrosine autokinase [Acidimicrobiales bacterium]|nr:polysaccharide biosynthesis tyrosine autokinase [Acidimicrobiales bacterium]
MERSATPEVSLVDYLRVLWRRKWLVVATVVAALAVSLFFSNRATPIYAASSRVLIAASDTTVFSSTGYVPPDPAQIDTQIEVMQSPPIAAAVARELGASAPLVTGVKVAGVGTTRILQITVRSPDPKIAAQAATLYATTYRDFKRTEAIDELVTLSTKLAEKTAQAKNQVDELDAQLARAQAGRASPAEVQSIKIQRDAAATSFVLNQQKTDQAQVDASVRSGGVQLLNPAAEPTTPVSPKPLTSAALALALGALVGAAAAIALDFLDDSFKRPDEVERLSRGLPILGSIPAVLDWRSRETPRLVTIEDPGDPVSEAYRALRTSVQFIGVRQELRTIQVSSPVASEGKTTTLANLAVTLALSGRRVAIVDCDLRRPRLHEFFGLGNDTGFTSVLLGDQPLAAALRRVSLPGGAALDLLPSGPLPPNPAELLGTSRVAELIAALRTENDYVLIDAPPVLPVTDAVVLSTRVDGLLLVATAGVTSRRHFSRALSTLQAADAPLLGIVVNGAPNESGYGYGYSSTYAQTDNRRSSSRRDPRPAKVG